MLCSRRHILCGLAIALKPAGAEAQEQDDDTLPSLPTEHLIRGQSADYNAALPSFATSGHNTPAEADIVIAKTVIKFAPTNCKPIEVANYFRGIGRWDTTVVSPIQSALGPSLSPRFGPHFARGWQDVYNPLIIEFFRATNVDPLQPNSAGDETPWCAAFVNWCIARSQHRIELGNKIPPEASSYGTGSASATSFRCWGTETTSPRSGDLAVWANNPPRPDCSGPGHVGFILGTGPRGALILGGNQGVDPGSSLYQSSGIIAKFIPKQFSTKRGATEILVARRTATIL